MKEKNNKQVFWIILIVALAVVAIGLLVNEQIGFAPFSSVDVSDSDSIDRVGPQCLCFEKRHKNNDEHWAACVECSEGGYGFGDKRVACSDDDSTAPWNPVEYKERPTISPVIFPAFYPPGKPPECICRYSTLIGVVCNAPASSGSGSSGGGYVPVDA